MCNRRNKPFCQVAILFSLLGALGYLFYVYSLLKLDFEKSNSDVDKYFRQQESLSSQLQVVYEHRATLERSLQKEKVDHKNTKLEFAKKQNDFILNITRSKHEAMNRFNSLETSHNMLKAQNKELQTQFNSLQQQYSRLSSEHLEIDKQQKRSFQILKEQKVNEIASLDAEIKTLKQQVVSLRAHLKTTGDELEESKISNSKALTLNQKYQKRIRSLQEQFVTYKGKLDRLMSQQNNEYGNAARDENQQKGQKRERQHAGLLNRDTADRNPYEQEKKKERDIHDESARLDNRGLEGQLPVDQPHYREPTAPMNDNDPVGSDMRRPHYKNNAKEEQMESRQNQRLKFVPLKNREKEVEVVSPTEKAERKWAEVLKLAQDDRAAKKGIEDNEVDDGAEEELNKEKDENLDEQQTQEAKDMQASEERLVPHPVNELPARAQEPAYMDKHIGRPVPRAGWQQSEKESDVNQGSNHQTHEGQGYNRQVAEQRGQQEPDIDRQRGRQEGQLAQDLNIRAAGQDSNERPGLRTDYRQEAEQQGQEHDNDNGQDDRDGKEQAHPGREEREVENVAEERQNVQGLSRQNINKQVAEMEEKEQAKKHDALNAADSQEKNIDVNTATGQLGAAAPVRAVKVDPQVDEEVHEAADQQIVDKIGDQEDDTDSDDEQDEEDNDEDESDGETKPQGNLQQPRVRPLQGQLNRQADSRSFDRALKGIVSDKSQNRPE